ncbi:hypothetical protein GIB67_009951 [Kingdonia uniflora]|nr:hypothetical protein GIB67_009951 [Kingdonia uniflora]
MCSSKAKTCSPVASIDGRPVLQPGGNRVPILERRNSLKKIVPKTPSPPPPPQPLPHSSSTRTTPPISPKSKSPRPMALKRGNDPNGLNSSVDKTLTQRAIPKLATLVRKKSKKSSSVASASVSVGVVSSIVEPSALTYASSLIVEAPGSIAAARREQVTLVQAQRKLRIAHYGRTKSRKFDGNVPVDVLSPTSREKRCTFITPNSDLLYVVYHDEEWGVPIHDDKLLFEMLVLSGAQVGSDWTSTLKKRQDFKEAFSGFDAEVVANLSEKQ